MEKTCVCIAGAVLLAGTVVLLLQGSVEGASFLSLGLGWLLATATVNWRYLDR